MPFNQQMTLPVQLTLRSAEDGVRLFAQPVGELESLRKQRRVWRELTPVPGDNPLRNLPADLFELTIDLSPDRSKSIELDLRGTKLVYETARQELVCKSVRAPLRPREGRVRLQVFLDRGSIEVFGNDGRIAMSIAATADVNNHSIAVLPQGGPIKVHSLVVYELGSAWGSP
jgi:fructan beta-fructosidase